MFEQHTLNLETKIKHSMLVRFTQYLTERYVLKIKLSAGLINYWLNISLFNFYLT